jgi:TFIIF-interacting CTD phosphatase-like protein
MAWADKATQRLEQAMSQFKGRRFRCASCGVEGEYDKDLTPCFTSIGQFILQEGDVFTASVETSFMCKDFRACQERQERKDKV